MVKITKKYLTVAILSIAMVINTIINLKGLIMKRKIVGTLLILIVAIMCCACGVETQTKQTTPPPEIYEEYDEYEFDITYKKDKDDHSPVVYVTEYGERYHTPTCYHTKNAYMKMTVKQAWDRGYTPCLKCCY